MNPSVHQSTPTITAIDCRGLQIRQVHYLRKVTGGSIEPLVTRQHHDVSGRPVEQWDPRLFVSHAKPNLTTIFGLTGQSLLVDSVDSGWRLSLPGEAGQTLLRWDERATQWRNIYDNLLRVVGIETNAQSTIELLTFGAADADAGRNLCGQLLRKVDATGSLSYGSYGLNALPLEETRTLFDGGVYATQWSYGADGLPLSQHDAGRHEQHSFYDVAGQLQQVTLKISDDDTPKDILKKARYNAEGQRIEQALGNDVTRHWFYDPANSRLQYVKAAVPGHNLRQDLEYEYDMVGNVVSLVDHTLKRGFFANQVTNGKRDFSYDSLYRLTSATGHDSPPPTDRPGLPLPSDPNNRLQYTQTYEYDTGSNLIKLVHSRATGGYTQRMFIDPASNRAVRWKEGDPDPDFSTQFDGHGNLQALQYGQPLLWNLQDELVSAALVERESGLHDQETFLYSGGSRVFKRHETHAPKTNHFHEVRYLPGLEIRARDNGEILHVIILPALIGNVRCLHWQEKRPDEIEQDQVRYCLDDSQNSSLIELDQNGRLISHEDYYPFGGTAALTATSDLEVSYKTLRYSGKEMDVSGLYYYGRRYYAPWLQRWISADPAGAVDGWNLYAMVGNNPVSFIDVNGLGRNKFGDGLTNRMTMRTTEILNPPNANQVPVEERQRFIKHNADAQFTAELKDKALVGHAGIALHIPEENTGDVLQYSDFFNIPREGGYSRNGNHFLTSLTSDSHGLVTSASSNPELGLRYPLSGGVLKVTAPEKLLEYMSNRYIQRFNDAAYPVRVYQGSSSAAVSLAGMEYEVAPIHPIIQNNIRYHISAAGGYLPYSAGLPLAHAEVQAGSFALHMQKNLTGSNDPAHIEIVVHRLKQASVAGAFPGCFNCSGTLLATYDNAINPFYVPTGREGMTHSMWRTSNITKDSRAEMNSKRKTWP